MKRPGGFGSRPPGRFGKGKPGGKPGGFKPGFKSGYGKGPGPQSGGARFGPPRGEGRFDGPPRDDRPPRRDFDDRPPRRDFRPGGDGPPRREWSDRPPRRDFGGPPRRDFGDGPPRRDFGDRPPRRDFGDRPPRRDFNDGPPRRDFRGGDDRPPRRDFGDRPPRRDFEPRGDGPPRREWSDRPPRRDFGDRPPRRDFDDRPPRRDFEPRGDGPPRRDFRDRDDRPPRDDRPRDDRPPYKDRPPFKDRPPKEQQPGGGAPFFGMFDRRGGGKPDAPPRPPKAEQPQEKSAQPLKPPVKPPAAPPAEPAISETEEAAPQTAPAPEGRAKVTVNRKAADRIASGHPWIFQSDVVETGGAVGGDPVTVTGPSGLTLGAAHFSSSSQISLRMLDTRAVEVDAAFYEARIAAARDWRKPLIQDAEAYRLVHGEGDFLPGLVVDRYGDCFSVQFLSQGMEKAKPHVVGALERLYSPRVIVARNDAASRQLEELPSEKETVFGEWTGPVDVRMNGLVWRADLMQGQKTGVFLDQRENHAAAAGYAHGKALDCFTCTGGFALTMASRCDSVEAIDSSASALETARANAAANNIANVEFREADVFEILTAYATGRRSFDTVVLDPPAFAKNRQSVENALKAYREINQRALKLLAPSGILVTCSCSHHVSEADLLGAVAQAALDAGKTVRVLERRFQSRDHPVLLSVPETLYLKCLILQVC